MKRLKVILFLLLALSGIILGQAPGPATPSRSMFFDWINSQYEGTTEEQTLINLEFFKWMHDRYGMQLDIYSLDVGNIDDGPYTAGVGRLIPYHYGNLESREFKEQFPHGFAPLASKAAEFGCRLGLWLGPGGFGDTPEDHKLRREMMVSLCRDYNFGLFKLDAVAGKFDKAKEEELLAETLKACRKYSPDLIVSSHRVDLGKVEPYITHHLWAGVETYVDVFINNESTAPHHRAGALDRTLTPNMDRMYEDHGVCLSSCLDYWDDELILQAFNRSLILAPQIYGNPWFLRDDEYPKLARIFNLHRKYRDLLVKGFQLDSVQYGPYAVSRGDQEIRFITLRNSSWESVKYRIDLDQTIGLKKTQRIYVRQFHPWEENIGNYRWGKSIEVAVLPFRTCLIAIGKQLNEPGLPKGPFQVTPTPTPFSPSEAPLEAPTEDPSEAPSEAPTVAPLVAPTIPYHYSLGPLTKSPVPSFAESLFESTCFTADNNALEVRSIQRSGASQIPQVEAARKAFLEKPMFINRGIWDQNLFDGDIETFFTARLEDRMFRLDLGKAELVDEIILKIRDRQYPELSEELERFDSEAHAEVSMDLIHWRIGVLESGGKGTIGRIQIPDGQPVQYVRVKGAPRRLAEVEGYFEGRMLDRSGWRASNLFFDYADRPARAAFTSTIKIDHAAPGSYLAVAVNGEHGHEKAWAALRVDGEFIGAPDRAVSFDSNTWEYYNVELDHDYTYFFFMDESYVGKEIEVWVLILGDGSSNVSPEVWMTAYPVPWGR